jgi:hypothetical protein
MKPGNGCLENNVYSWKSDTSDEEILKKLLALNLERAKEVIEENGL